MFVYLVRNQINEKVYIGKWQGSRVKDRWREHIRDAQAGAQRKFYSAIRKYGPKSFTIEILYRAKTPVELSRMETFFIILHQSHLSENGYNMTLGGDGKPGFKHREENWRW